MAHPVGMDLQRLEEQILLALQGIRYGSVEIIIHDSKIVQIERHEKLRFQADWTRA